MFSASAPGSVMLLGEHAVLHGFAAISASINLRITVTLTPHASDTITIESTLGSFSCNKNSITIAPPFTFVLAALKSLTLPSGFVLRIDSEFKDNLGLGSSAAVTVATLKCLYAWQGLALSPQTLLRKAIEVIHAVQGIGSGADCAASVYGGAVYYKMMPCIVERLPYLPTIRLIYTGYKTKTVDVLTRVAKAYQTAPSLYDLLYKKIGACAEQGKTCIIKRDWQMLGAIFHQQQQLMQALGVSDATSQHIIDHALTHHSVLGAKISGSGLGDCIIVLGTLPSHFMQNNDRRIAVLSGVNGEIALSLE